jgi:hypothetical protein
MHSAIYLAMSYELQKIPMMCAFLEKKGIARNIEGLVNKNVIDDKVLISSKDELIMIVRSVDKAVVLIIPSRNLWQVGYADTERMIHDKFVRMLLKEGVSVVDMRPALEATGSPTEYYFKTDPHWNEDGHALAARLLADHLKR